MVQKGEPLSVRMPSGMLNDRTAASQRHGQLEALQHTELIASKIKLAIEQLDG